MRKLLLVVSVLAVAGCMTVGREISTAQVDSLKKGQTTTAEAVATLGQPTGISTMSDGRKTLTYSFGHVQSRPATFIPFVGAFVGGADVRSTALILTFDSAGILLDYVSHESSASSGMGLASGQYKAPNGTLAQESK